jgi:hypothetical protein
MAIFHVGPIPVQPETQDIRLPQGLEVGLDHIIGEALVNGLHDRCVVCEELILRARGDKKIEVIGGLVLTRLHIVELRVERCDMGNGQARE